MKKGGEKQKNQNGMAVKAYIANLAKSIQRLASTTKTDAKNLARMVQGDFLE